MAKKIEHTLIEDAQAFVLGSGMCALGVTMLTHLGLITGQTAGLAVLLSYVLDASFGTIFFIVNLPFYAFAWLQLGARFTINSFISVALLSVMSEVFPMHLQFAELSPWLGAILIGASVGLGLMVLIRHGSSLGGIGVLALFLQERFGVQAGWVQLGFDLLLFTAAIFVIAPDIVTYSLLGAVIVNLIVGINHRKDRYIGR